MVVTVRRRGNGIVPGAMERTKVGPSPKAKAKERARKSSIAVAETKGGTWALVARVGHHEEEILPHRCGNAEEYMSWLAAEAEYVEADHELFWAADAESLTPAALATLLGR